MIASSQCTLALPSWHMSHLEVLDIHRIFVWLWSSTKRCKNKGKYVTLIGVQLLPFISIHLLAAFYNLSICNMFFYGNSFTTYAWLVRQNPLFNRARIPSALHNHWQNSPSWQRIPRMSCHSNEAVDKPAVCSNRHEYFILRYGVFKENVI